MAQEPVAGDRELDYIYWDALRDLGSFGRGLVRVSRDYYVDIVRRYDATTFLDLGCGFGDTYSLFKQRGVKIYYVGQDVTPNFVDEAQRRHPKVDFRVGRIQEIPHSYGSFEIVTCRCVLEHLPDPEQAIREMARVSTKAVVIVWFKWPGDSERIKYNKRGFWENAYSRDRILEFTDSIGLRLVDELTVKHHLVWTLEKQ
jgi:ubiquinone/menaquinone biosynthesis C-methylase UbiE